MELHRLRPATLPNGRSGYAGRCGACDQAITHGDEIVHLYGEAFHHGCAFYRHLVQNDRDHRRTGAR
jgi:hypothetical protein